MNEMMFGSPASFWPSAALPVLSWPVSPFSRAGASSGPMVPPLVPPSPTASAPLRAAASQSPLFATEPMVNIPFVAPELTPYAVQTLLAAVAIRRGQPLGPTNDQEIEDFIYDALELLPGTSEVEVRCEAGRLTITGSVQHKRLKHDLGEIVWSIPVINDVQNNLTIATRRRARVGTKDGEPPSSSVRKQG